MKNYLSRMVFGSERKMMQAGAERCNECGCTRESEHLPGCSEEECPDCGRALIGCCCERLSPHEAEKIIQGVYSQFTDLETALKAAGEERCTHATGASYLQHALMRFIFDNVPEDAKTEITRAFHIRFPGLVPKLQDDEGRGYYTAEQLSEALDIPLNEVYERIDAMVAASGGISFGVGKKLRKIH